MHVMGWAVLLIVAWGTLAFGAPYDWAYWPLLAACVAVGVWGLLRRVRSVRRGVHAAVLAGLLLTAGAIGVQLVPLERATLQRVSPATDAFLMKYDVGFALRVRQAQAPQSASQPDQQRATQSIPQPASQPIQHPISINPPRTWVGLAMLGALGIFLLGLARGLGGRDLRTIAPGLTAFGVVLAFIGIAQKAVWNGKVYGFWEPLEPGSGPFGPFINRNHFAGWMLLVIPVAIGYFSAQIAKGMQGVKPGWRRRIVWFSTNQANRTVLTGFAIVVMGFALVMTLSRSGVTCLLLALAISAINVWRHQATLAKKRWLSGYLVFVFVLAVSWAGIDALAARFAEVDWKMGGRALAWEDGWRIHEMFPWLGTGFNTYGTATVLYQRNDLVSHYLEAHNDYLQILVEGGWLVAVPVLLTILLFAREVWKRFKEAEDDPTGYWIRLGAVTGMVAMAFQSVVEFSLQMPGNAALFCVLAAIAIRRTAANHRSPNNHSGSVCANAVSVPAGRHTSASHSLP